MTFYGTAVCPFIASLAPITILLIMAISIIIVLIIKGCVISRYREKQLGEKSYFINPSKLVLYEFLAWLILSVGVGAFNLFVFEFPVGSAGKLTVGFITIGLYSSISTMLDEDRARIIAINEWENDYDPGRYFFSLVNKLLIFIFSSLILLSTIFVLLFQNNFVFMVDYYQETNNSPTVPIIKHILYVFFVLFIGIFNLGLKYSDNLKLILDSQLEGFKRVLHGDYSKRIPVATNDELGLIAKLSNKLVVELSNKENENLALYSQNIHDKLTSLYNRNYFDEIIEREIQLCNRDRNASFSLLMLDVDHFKNINDTHGHDIGDNVLQQIANCMLETIRKTDLAFRYGGDEFCILLLTIDKGGATVIASKLLENCRNLEIECNDKKLTITVSIGLSSFDENNSSDKALIKAADLALYQSKSNGRDQLYCS